VVQNDHRLSLARARQNVRQIDTKIQQIRAEERLFQRFGFGSDVHEIQLTALRAERRDLVNEIEGLVRRSSRSGLQRSGVIGWLLLPPALWAMFRDAVRRRHHRSRPPTGEP